MVDQGNECIKEAAMVKLLGSEIYNRVADKAVQIHGGIGYISEFQSNVIIVMPELLEFMKEHQKFKRILSLLNCIGNINKVFRARCVTHPQLEERSLCTEGSFIYKAIKLKKGGFFCVLKIKLPLSPVLGVQWGKRSLYALPKKVPN